MINQERQIRQMMRHDPVLANQTLDRIADHPELTESIIKSAMRTFADNQQERLAMTTTQTNGQPNQAEAPNLGEAPASATAKMVSPRGVEWLLTARDSTVKGLMEKVEYMEDHLLNHDWQPANARRAAPSVSAQNGAGNETPVCPYHGEMKPSTKAPGTFYCPSRMGDGSYCKEKA